MSMKRDQLKSVGDMTINSEAPLPEVYTEKFEKGPIKRKVQFEESDKSEES